MKLPTDEVKLGHALSGHGRNVAKREIFRSTYVELTPFNIIFVGIHSEVLAFVLGVSSQSINGYS